jgi:hypothetical protein
MGRNDKKRKRYSKDEIQLAKKKGDITVITQLVSNLLDGVKMSMIETEAAVLFAANTRPEGSISKINLAAIPEAQNSIFITLFLAYYADLEGKYGILKFSGYDGLMTRFVSIEEKIEDIIRLNEYYSDWERKFTSNRHTDQILNIVINEVRNIDLKAIDSELGKGSISNEDYKYKRKAIILWSKYLYLRVSRIFDEIESKQILVDFGGIIITITIWSMVHILNRHYAAVAKQSPSSKSFHQDVNLKFFEDPEQLKIILEKIGRYKTLKPEHISFIPFKLNGIVYSIYTEKKIGNNGTQFIQLQTFYPTEDRSELSRIGSEFNEVEIEVNLVGYYRK